MYIDEEEKKYNFSHQNILLIVINVDEKGILYHFKIILINLVWSCQTKKTILYSKAFKYLCYEKFFLDGNSLKNSKKQQKYK